jgi:hypothetical protein
MAEVQGLTKVLRQLDAHCAVPHAGILPLDVGVIITAKVLPLFNAPAEIGSKEIPNPVVVLPLMFALVLFVVQPVIEFPVGQVVEAVSLKYHLHVYPPEPTGFDAKVILEGFPDPQKVSSANVTEPGLNGGRTVI